MVPPAPAFTQGCAGLLALAQVQEQVVARVAVRVDERSIPTTPTAIASAERGGFRCVWGGTSRTDTGYDDGLVVDIFPNITVDQFDSRTTDANTPAISGIGDEATLGCDSVFSLCTGDTLANGYWIVATFSDSDRKTNAPGHGRSAYVSLVGRVATALAGADVGAPWVTPESTFPGRDLCAPESAAEIRVIAGSTSVPTLVAEEDYVGPSTILPPLVGMTSCSWSNGLGFVSMPGSAWDLGAQLTHPVSWDWIGDPVVENIPGADATLAGCGEHCEADLKFGNSVLFVSAGTIPLGDFLPMLQRVPAAVHS